MKIVDAHHHLWDLGSNNHPWLQSKHDHNFFLGDYSQLRRSYMPNDYQRDCCDFDIVKTVHIEAEWRRDDQVGETRWISEMSNRHRIPSAIVAHAWLDQPNTASILLAHASYPLVRGIRSKPKTAPNTRSIKRGAVGTMSDPRWRAGYAMLEQLHMSFDLRVPLWHLEEARELALDFPNIPIVLNHAGFPWDRSRDGLSQWRTALHSLATAPNTFAKISCLLTKDHPWNSDENRRIVLETIEIFGVSRCMFASNFPVDGLRIGYRALWDFYLDAIAELPVSQQRALVHDNAINFYRLNDPS